MSRRSNRPFAVVALAAGLVTNPALAQLSPPTFAIPYGNNAPAGDTADINGIKLYYEVYGAGAPLLVIHGNGGNIGSVGHQIEYFSPHYRVIAADSRGHGKSGMGPGRLTYEQQAEDLNALLAMLGVKSARVLGWSDGGILGLLLAIHHPDKVGRLAIMGANLEPEGAYPWAQAWVTRQNETVDAMIAKGDKSQPWPVMKQYLDLLGKQPHIPVEDLARIEAPALVMAGDKDVIRLEHTQRIFDHLKRAHLAIFPGATHMIPWEDHGLFNQTVERFFRQDFVRPDTREIFK
jgi:pimeloyl-ACP methyl ester carboxylesterase